MAIKDMAIAVRRKVRKLMGNNTTVLIRGMNSIYIDDSKERKLQEFRNKFIICRGEVDDALFNDREETYGGTHDVELNINNRNTNVIEKQSNQPYNIAYELIESQVNNNVPLPVVKSKREDYKYQGRMIEDSLKNDIADTAINKVNDRNERTTYKHGFSAVEVIWDPTVKGNDYTGEIKLVQRHPKSIVPQVGVWDTEFMDYCFTQLSVTKQSIWQTFGIELTNEQEQYPEINTVSDESVNNLSEKVTIITCWYKDSDGDVGKFSWVDNTVIEDKPKFFYRRPNKCPVCGNIGGAGEMVCKCGARFVQGIEEFEILPEDKTLTRTDKLTQFVADPESGELIPQVQEVPVVIPAGTRIRYFVPKELPIIIRLNVPKDFGFGGVSDIDVIKDKYVLISKLMNNIEEKLLQGGYIITCPEDMKLNLTNNIYQVVKGTSQQLAGISVKDLSLDVQKDLEVVQVLYEQAKSTLGITDSYQGKPDPTATSGVAKQLMIEQASGRMASKELNKHNFYINLYKMMFWMKLAFYDELRPVLAKEENGDDKFFDFDKYEFLLKGKEGEWYYNTDFQFTIDATGGWEKNRDYMYQQAITLFQGQAFVASEPSIMLWTMLDNLNFPGAGAIKTSLAESLKQQQAALEEQMAMQEKLRVNSQQNTDLIGQGGTNGN